MLPLLPEVDEPDVEPPDVDAEVELPLPLEPDEDDALELELLLELDDAPLEPELLEPLELPLLDVPPLELDALVLELAEVEPAPVAAEVVEPPLPPGVLLEQPTAARAASTSAGRMGRMEPRRESALDSRTPADLQTRQPRPECRTSRRAAHELSIVPSMW